MSDEEFDEVTNGNDWVLIDFWAPWCPPCKALSPILEQVAQERENLLIAKVNTDTDPTNAARLGVRGIPHLSLFHNGTLTDQRTGMMPKPALDKWLNEQIG